MNLREKISAFLLFVLACFTGLLPFAAPQACAQALQEGLALCSGPLMLSLAPFLVVSALLIRCPAGELLGLPFRPAVRLMGLGKCTACAARVLLIGFLGGFAPAAHAAAQAVQTGQLTAEQADTLLPACVCSGPSFVILTVGQHLLGSRELGACLFAAQVLAGYLSAAVLARLCPCKGRSGTEKNTPAAPVRLDRIVADSTMTYLKLCGFVLYFRMLATGLGAVFPPGAALLGAILLEVCSGCDLASRTGLWGSTLCCAALSLQGLSVLLQVRTICPPEMTLRPLFRARVLHLPLSLAFFSLLVPAGERMTAAFSQEKVIILRRIPPDCAFLVFVVCCLAAAQLTNLLAQCSACSGTLKKEASCGILSPRSND